MRIGQKLWFLYLSPISEGVRFFSYSDFSFLHYFLGLEIFKANLRQALYQHLASSGNDEEKDMLISVVLPILIRGKNSDKRIGEEYIMKLLARLSVTREHFATPSLIQIVNHGISFGENVNNRLLTAELLKRLSQGGNEIKNLSVNELQIVLKYLNRVPLEDRMGK